MVMRRVITATVVAGAAGVALGLMPVGGAFAAGLPQTQQNNSGWCSDDWRGGNNWRDCCDSSRWHNWNDRPSWCWDNDSSNNGRHNNANWNDNWNNGRWNDSGSNRDNRNDNNWN